VTGPDSSPDSAPVLHEQLAAFASGDDPASVLTGAVSQGHRPKVAFLFTGQGAQYPGMGRSLYDSEPTFRNALEHAAAVLDGVLERPLLSVLYPQDNARTALDQTGFTQPALFALEYALARTWQSWGVTPDIVLGHSVGELAAACVAGAFSLEDGLRLIAERARLIQSLPPGGAMTAVFTDADTLGEVLEPHREHLNIATVNGPKLLVVSGARGPMAVLMQTLKERGIRHKAITVSHAFHSPLMDPMLDTFAQFAQAIAFRPLQLPLVSNRDGRIVPPGAVLDAAYWRAHIREAVQFHRGMQSLAEAGCAVLLEVGPASTLLGMGRRCVQLEDALWRPSLNEKHDDWQVLLDSLAAAWVRGVPVDWVAFDRPYERQRLT